MLYVAYSLMCQNSVTHFFKSRMQFPIMFFLPLRMSVNTNALLKAYEVASFLTFCKIISLLGKMKRIPFHSFTLHSYFSCTRLKGANGFNSVPSMVEDDVL